MSKLSIHLLGGMHVVSGSGQVLGFPGKKAQALLAYLASYPGRPNSRGKLATLLWEDSGDIYARASLRQALMLLRRVLGSDESLVVGRADAVILNGERADIDTVEFERLLALGTSDALERATSLYEGEFLEALNPRAPAFEDWLMGERRRYRERAVEAMSCLLQRYMDSGSTERAIGMAVKLLPLDPLQESVHRSLMQLYARQGREASALRQFQICRDLLRRELGIEPDPETERVYRDIRRKRYGRSSTTVLPGSDHEAQVASIPQGGALISASAEAECQEGGAPITELRQVTVVCVDMAEPTTAAYDLEQMQSMSDRFAENVREVVKSYGGRVERQLGGSVVALFGMPPAHTDDVERALRAAMRIRDAASGSDEAGSMLCDVQIGVADGQVLVTREDGAPRQTSSVVGDALTLASRLAGAAGANEILLADGTYRTFSSLLEDAQPREIATHGRRLHAWLAKGSCVPSHSAKRPSFVGRTAELRQFSAAVAACRETEHGMTIHLRGEPGIGKSRLVEEFIRIAAGQGFVCHFGAVVDFGAGRERDPVCAIVRSLLRWDEADPIAGEEAVARALEEGQIDEARQAYLCDLLQLRQPDEMQAFYEAVDNATRTRGKRETVVELVRRASTLRPVMVIIEDVHWADAAMLEQAAALAKAAVECSIVLVLTARPDGDPVDGAWRALAGGGPVVTMDLGPLRRDEAIAFAAEFTGSSDPFAADVVDRAGGNPLFLEQLLRAGRDDVGGLPGSVQSVVLTRIDRLSVPDRKALRVASVLGQRFDVDELRYLLEDPGYSSSTLLQHGLIRPDGDGFQFSHALVQEGVYTSIPRSQRRELHRRAADWFGEKDLFLRAEHLVRAESSTAPQACLEAARVEVESYRYERALKLVERGTTLDADPETRFLLELSRGEILHHLGELLEAKSAYESSLGLAQGDAGRCRAWLGLAAVKRITDDLDGALADLALAHEAASQAELKIETAQVHHMRGNVLFPRGDLDGCLREHQKALELAQQAGSAELIAAALGGIADAEYMRGRMISAHQRFCRCVALSREHGFGRIEVANRPMVAATRWFTGDTAGALEDCIAAVDAATRVGHRRAALIAQQTAYMCRLSLGDFSGAKRDVSTALDLARELGAVRFEAVALAHRGELHRLAGEHSHALRDLAEALALARQTGVSYMGPSILGMLALAAEDKAAREEAIKEAELLLAVGCVSHNHLFFRKYAIDAYLAGDAWDEAARQAAALQEFAHEEPIPWASFFAARGYALASHGKGRDDEALESELRHLRDQGNSYGYKHAVAAINSVLDGAAS